MSTDSTDANNSTDSTDTAEAAVSSVLTRYSRIEQIVSWTLVAAAIVVVVAALYTLPPVGGVVVAVAAVLTLRLPVFRLHSEARVVTDASTEAVREAMLGTRPPVLVFQWGVADRVETGEGVRYHYSAVFGLRTATLAVDRRETADGIEITLVADGAPYATHRVTITGGEKTAVTVESDPPRGFGLRRLPGWIATQRQYAAGLNALGYDVREYETSFGLRGLPLSITRE
jgi:hypothetical protein